jgi:hypothetical protein
VYSLVMVISVPAGTVRPFTEDSLRIGFVIVATLVNVLSLLWSLAYARDLASSCPNAFSAAFGHFDSDRGGHIYKTTAERGVLDQC